MAIAQKTTPQASTTGDADQDLVQHMPVLENGDHLTRTEFERRYEAMPNLKKAELVEGVVYLGSPVRASAHAMPHAAVVTWLGYYGAHVPGVDMGDNATVRLDQENEPQPDVLLRLETELGGSSRVDENDYVDGPPELVVEVAASSVSIDRHAKLRAYRRNGVQEYVLWRVLDRALEWFSLQEGEYVPLQPDERGVVHSRVFPGLRLHVQALLDGDLAAVLAEQQTGFTSTEYKQFLEALASKRTAATH
jgi:Uma2 family endonuclease